MASTPVKFRVTTGEPALIEVEGLDGQTYELRTQFTVFEVTQKEGEVNAQGMPAFELKVMLSTDTKRRPR